MPFKTLVENWEIIKNWYKKFTQLSCEKKILVFCLFFICFAVLYFLGRGGFINEKWENNIRRIEQCIISCINKNKGLDRNTIIYGDKAISTGFTIEKARKTALLDAENNLLNKFTETQKSKVRQHMSLSIDTTYKNIRGTYTAEARYMVDDKYLED